MAAPSIELVSVVVCFSGQWASADCIVVVNTAPGFGRRSEPYAHERQERHRDGGDQLRQSV